MERPGERDLRGGQTVARGDPVEYGVALRERRAGSHGGRGERAVREERDAAGFTKAEDRVARLIAEMVAVLHGDDGEEALRRFDLLDGDIRETDVPELPLLAQF